MGSLGTSPNVNVLDITNLLRELLTASLFYALHYTNKGYKGIKCFFCVCMQLFYILIFYNKSVR